MTARDLYPEERAALVDYAQRHGRNWKSKLSAAWQSGGMEEGTSGILRSLRNSHGPSWLERFRLKPSIFRLDLEDHGQDLTWIECDAATGAVTDCGPFHQSLYVGKTSIDVTSLRKDRTVRIKRGVGDFKSLNWPMVQLSQDGKVIRSMAAAA